MGALLGAAGTAGLFLSFREARVTRFRPQTPHTLEGVWGWAGLRRGRGWVNPTIFVLTLTLLPTQPSENSCSDSACGGAAGGGRSAVYMQMSSQVKIHCGALTS